MALHRAVAVAKEQHASWRTIGLLVAGISLWQGFGFGLKGEAFTSSRGWAPLVSLLSWAGGLHAHGAIMVVLGFALAVQLRGPYDRLMKWTLRLLRTYCLVVAFCWFGSWTTPAGVSWGAPGWWLLLAALTTWMTWFAPALVVHHPREGRGRA